MQNKYNIVLIPTSKSSNIIDLAHEFSAVSDQYLLGHNSNPHVTLCQFYADKNKINNIWEQVYNILTKKN